MLYIELYERTETGHFPMVTCKDGFSISIQGATYNYCEPRDNSRVYSQVELGFPSASDPLIQPYAEDLSKPTDTVYPYVPANVVRKLLDKHGGTDSSLKFVYK